MDSMGRQWIVLEEYMWFNLYVDYGNQKAEGTGIIYFFFFLMIYLLMKITINNALKTVSRNELE